MTTTTTTADSFATSSAQIHLHRALDVLLQPSTHLVTVLQYSGLDGIAALRTYPFFRERVSQLTAEELKSIGLPVEGLGLSPNQFLKSCLIESFWQEVEAKDGDNSNSSAPCGGGGGGVGGVGGVGGGLLNKPRKRCWKFNTLGLISLASSPLATERALCNLILLPIKLPSAVSAQISAPGFYIDERTRRLIYEEIAKNSASSPHVLTVLVQRLHGAAGSPYDRVFHYVARHTNSTPDVLKLLLKVAPDEHTREAIAKNPNATSQILSCLIDLTYDTYPTSGNPIVLSRVAGHANTGEGDLKKLSLHKNSHVRRAVAANTNAPVDVLQLLSSDEEYTVVLAAAGNPSLPAKDLARLGLDEKWIVRQVVGKNPNLDLETLARLSKDIHVGVRNAVAINPSILVDVIFDLDDSSNWPVLARYSKDPEKLRCLIRKEDSTTQALVAANACTPEDVLASYASSEDIDVRSAVAGNPNTPTSTLNVLAKDPTGRVRSSVASNTSTPVSVLESLAEDDDDGVKFDLAGNSNTSAQCLGEIIPKLIHRRTFAPFEETNNEEEFVRTIFSREDLPVEALTLMSKSRWADLRQAAAGHSRLPPAELARLGRDPISTVANCAAKNIVMQTAADKLSCLLSSNGLGEEDIQQGADASGSVAM